jgi:hypothetical protein
VKGSFSVQVFVNLLKHGAFLIRFLNWRTTNLQKDLAYALLRAVA